METAADIGRRAAENTLRSLNPLDMYLIVGENAPVRLPWRGAAVPRSGEEIEVAEVVYLILNVRWSSGEEAVSVGLLVEPKPDTGAGFKGLAEAHAKAMVRHGQPRGRIR